MKKLVSILTGFAIILMAGPVSAHHSSAHFDQTKLVLIKGEVTKFSFVNPHSWISLNAAVEGKAPKVRWDIETTAPSSLTRLGINRETLKPGDEVTVAIRPLRDGRPGGSLVFIATADGKTYGANPDEVGVTEAQLKALR